MSISRKNWSALSSKARQWTMEDEEEVERERRRRVKSSTSNADPEDDLSPTRRDSPASDGAFDMDSGETSPRHSSVDPTQSLDFMEMLRVRDEKRRLRHVETLRRQKEVVGSDERLGPLDSNGLSGKEPGPLSPGRPSKTTITNGQHDESEERPPTRASKTGRKFVSSVSISVDSSRSPSGSSTPTSPFSPTAIRSPGERTSPLPGTTKSPVHNGHTRPEAVSRATFSFSPTSSSTNNKQEQSATPGLARQSSRTVSFRMIKKREEESAPLRRSASVRMTSKKFEPDTNKGEEEDKLSLFQRNSRQRVSSRSIQEKMEQLAQAAQRSDTARATEGTPRPLYLVDEVSKKRGIFEREQQASSPTSQETRPVKSGVSDRINRWLHRSSQSGTTQTPSDVRPVDISSKRSVFEKSAK
ncbi:ladinin-1 [Synchiropus splendidus]|uniref:ladinin-1 n=1 Tax=Synchiropus splendidus TaxID=270530 RepID=UPI00237E01F5|nr:ladinin-1 [Synchiropus splendidus]